MFPAGPIAWIVALVLCVTALGEASGVMRLVFIAALVLLYVIPLLSPALIPSLALLLARVVLGIVCYFYLKTASLRLR